MADSCDIVNMTSADCNANSIPDECDLAVGTSPDVNGNGIPDECEDCPPTDAPTTETVVTPKNRFLTIVPDNMARSVAVRVLFSDLPPPHDVLNGKSMWLGASRLESEDSGVVDPEAAPGADTFAVAQLLCDPFYTIWNADEEIHVYHESIVPGGAYDVQVIDESCIINNESHFSPSLVLTTSIWGDVVKDCTGMPCGPPDGSVDIVTDVTSILNKFQNLANAPRKSRMDLEPAIPDRVINISDVTFALNAFSSSPYPFEPGPFPCGL